MKLATLATLTILLAACDGTSGGSYYVPPVSTIDAAELRRIENRQIIIQNTLDNLQNQQGGVGVARGVRY